MDWLLTLLAFQAAGFFALGARVALWIRDWEPGASRAYVRRELEDIEQTINDWRDQR